jgi:hypothetical protein
MCVEEINAKVIRGKGEKQSERGGLEVGTCICMYVRMYILYLSTIQEKVEDSLSIHMYVTVCMAIGQGNPVDINTY